MRLLLVEDDKKIGSYLEQGFKEAGYTTDLAEDGEVAMHFATSHQYDLIVLDIMIPKADGLAVIEKLRRLGHRIPIIILSAKQTVDDRIKGLQLGADDYLTKPFSFSELLLRVQSLLRRATPQEKLAQSSKLQAGDIELDLFARQATRSGKPIDLQTKEFALLEYFLKNPGRVLTKTQILENVWNYQFDPQTNVVDVLVFRLRTKIDKNFEKKSIQTIRGVGYVFQPN